MVVACGRDVSCELLLSGARTVRLLLLLWGFLFLPLGWPLVFCFQKSGWPSSCFLLSFLFLHLLIADLLELGSSVPPGAMHTRLLSLFFPLHFVHFLGSYFSRLRDTKAAIHIFPVAHGHANIIQIDKTAYTPLRLSLPFGSLFFGEQRGGGK